MSDSQKIFDERVKILLQKAPGQVFEQFQESVNNLTKSGANSYSDLIAIVLNTTQVQELRMDAVWLLGQIGYKEHWKFLISVFDDSDYNLFWQAANSLRLLKSKRSVPILLAYLKDNSNPEKQRAAAYALSMSSNKLIIDLMLDIFKQRNTPTKVRAQIAETLSCIGKGLPEVIDTLAHELKDAEIEVRFWSIFALGQLGNLHTIPYLEFFIEDNNTLLTHGSIRDEALMAISQIEMREKSKG